MPNEMIEAKPLEAVVIPKSIDNRGVTAYVWKRGVTLFLSKKNWLLADEFVNTRSYEACQRRLKGEMGISLGLQSVKNRLGKDEVKEWIGEQMEERGVYSGWGREHFIKVLSDHITGIKKLNGAELYAMNLMGKYKGFGDFGTMNQNNIQINFHERG